jgi:hypothetical protein
LKKTSITLFVLTLVLAPPTGANSPANSPASALVAAPSFGGESQIALSNVERQGRPFLSGIPQGDFPGARGWDPASDEAILSALNAGGLESLFPREKVPEEVVYPTILADVLPTEQERERSTLLFWQAPVPSSTGSSSPYETYAEMARYTQMHRKGPFSYSLRLNALSIYDDNITLATKDKRGDLHLAVGPALRVLLGADESTLRLGANYNGTASWFARTPAQRSYEQNFGIDGGWSGSRLKLGFRAGIQDTRSGSVDAGDRVGRQVFYWGLTSSYPFTAKLGAELSADITRADFDGLLGSREYRAQQYVNYQITPKVQLGLGATEGLLCPDGGLEQTYEQALLRAVAQPTAKLSVNLSTGMEHRHFESGLASTFTPVYNALVSWQATGQTSFSLEGRRRVFSSASLGGQNYASTNLTLSAREMLTATVDATLSIGGERADYKAAAAAVVASRRDEFVFTRASVDWALFKNCSFGVFYEFSRNLSRGPDGHPFQRNRAGLSVCLSF